MIKAVIFDLLGLFIQRGKVSEKMIEIAKRLKKKNFKVFILSNNFIERASFYDDYPWIHDVVDKTYFSWQTGFVKPDPKAWELILEENNLKAEECLFFDDSPMNVEVANGLGIKSYLFTNEEELGKVINNEL